MTRDSGPVPGKDSLAERVLLAEPQSSHTGSLEPEVEAADACEEASDGELPIHVPPPAAPSGRLEMSSYKSRYMRASDTTRRSTRSRS